MPRPSRTICCKRLLGLLALLIIWGCQADIRAQDDSPSRYISLSRFTDPQDFAVMLADLPDDVLEICRIAEQQTVHHNLLVHYGIPYSSRRDMKSGWPPRMVNLLRDLNTTEPYDLYAERDVRNRIVGACMVESHFLAGLLRHKKIPARVRPGYFQDIIVDADHYHRFWETNLRGREVMKDLLDANPEQWNKEIRAFTTKQTEDNHYIEHWICEYWDETMQKWCILDANTSFLEACCGIEVGYRLPDKHYEYAHEAWKKMRTENSFNPDRYAEEPLDGRSHIRKSLLWDFYSLLNHDVAGFDSPFEDVREFVTNKIYIDLTTEEIEELDALADLLSGVPTVGQLIRFYKNSATLKIRSIEKDPYSFIHGE